MGSGDQVFHFPADLDEKKCRECFSFLRLLVCDTDEWEMISNHGRTIQDINPLTIRNEIAVLECLAEAAHQTLEAFGTTIEQDNDILRHQSLDDTGTPLTLNERNCVIMRRGEKLVALYFIELAENMAPLLKLNGDMFHDAVWKHRLQLQKFEPYIDELEVLFSAQHDNRGHGSTVKHLEDVLYSQ